MYVDTSIHVHWRCKCRIQKSTLENFAKPVAADLYIGGCPEGQMSMIFGLVEYNDGTMGEVNPSQIRFVDNKIKDYAFEEG